jgi:RNA polymerase sigma-70 factor (ECF subfamily)
VAAPFGAFRRSAVKHVGVPASIDEVAEEFQRHRPRLFGVAYRILGSASEAEDVLQEVWLRWQAYDRDAVQDPLAFLVTTTTRQALTVLQSARVRRETYIGPWLPEPIDTGASPELAAEHDEALGIAVLHLLESLSPTERAAYVLHEAFGYPHEQIADILETSEAASRQLVSRARKHLATGPRRSVGPDEQRRLLEAFLAAARQGDLSRLEHLFAEDVVSYSDGGGVVRATRRPVAGRTQVAKLLKGFSKNFWPDMRLDFIEVNGQPAARATRGDELIGVIAIHATDAGIDRLYWLVNPEKLGFVPVQ